MPECYFCGEKITGYLPFRCSFCGRYFCSDHRLPENHNCQELEEYRKEYREKELAKGKLSWDYLGNKRCRNSKYGKQHHIKAKPKSTSKKITDFIKYKILPRKIQYWIRRSPKYLTQNIAFLIIYGLIMIILYRNIDILNNMGMPLIKAGSLILLIVALLFIRRIHWILKSIKYVISPNQKIILLIILVILTVYLYINQETYIQQLATYNASFDYTRFNPLPVNLSRISILEVISGKPEKINKDTYDIELIVFRETNKIRRNHGLRELIWDPLLSDIARQHSLEMASTNSFTHTNLEGEDPTDRAEKRDYETITIKGDVYQIGIGENIGMMPKGDVEGHGYISTNTDVAEAMVNSWMNSKGHRANILDPSYEFIGVGVAYDLEGQYYLTQDFK